VPPDRFTVTEPSLPAQVGLTGLLVGKTESELAELRVIVVSKVQVGVTVAGNSYRVRCRC